METPRILAIAGVRVARSRIRHLQDDREIPTADQLKIARYSEEPEVCLIYFRQGTKLLTTFHASVAEAKAQAEFDLSVQQSEWVEVNPGDEAGEFPEEEEDEPQTDVTLGPCLICGGNSYSWGRIVGEHEVRFRPDQVEGFLNLLFGGTEPIRARKCNDCSNIQIFGPVERW